LSLLLGDEFTAVVKTSWTQAYAVLMSVSAGSAAHQRQRLAPDLSPGSRST
jgi:hypothetical protein